MHIRTLAIVVATLTSAQISGVATSMTEKYNVAYLFSDFKKKEGYKRSIELSKIYHLYRQDYCGCIYSKKERDEKNENKKCQL